MNLPFHKNRRIGSRRFLFPLLSLLFHLALFFFFIGVQINHPALEIKEEEIIAMIDLNALPPQLKPPEAPKPVLPLESPSSPPEAETADTATPVPSEPEPILDPTLDEALLDEALEDTPEPEMPAPIETAQNIVIPPPSPPEASEASEPEPAVPSDPVSEAEPEPAMSAEAASKGSPEPEPFSEEPPGAESEPGPSVPEPPAPEPALPAEPSPPSAQEVAKTSEVQDPQKPATEKKVVATVKKPVPPPPKPKPKPKPSKDKVKKSGLLGLLGAKKRDKPSKNPLFANKGLNRPRNKRLQVSAPRSDAAPTESRQQLASLRNKLLKAEQKKLMTKRSVGRKKKSQLKIVQGSGRNFGVISSAIAQEEWRLTTVYNRLLQQSPGLQGNLIIEFTISPEGKVIKSHVLTSSFANPHFEKALIQQIRLWKFPVAKEGETVILYPLAFSPAG